MNILPQYTLKELEQQKYDLIYTPMDKSIWQNVDDFQKYMEERQQKLNAIDSEIARVKSYLPVHIDKVAQEITDTLLYPFTAAFEQVMKQHTVAEKNKEKVTNILAKEDIVHKHQQKKIKENLVLIHNGGIALDTLSNFDIKNFVHQLIYSDYISTAFAIMDRLHIPKNICYLYRVDHALSFGVHNREQDARFFHMDLFEECIAHFGEDELRNIFIYDAIPPTHGNRVIKNPISGKSIHDRMEEGGRIAKFCMHTGFDSGMAGVHGYLSIGTFMTPIGNENKHNDVVHYLGSYASEIRYFIEKLHIPFSTLFALPKEDIALYCGLLRSLANCTRHKRREYDQAVDFITGNVPSALDPADIFCANTLVYYIHQNNSIPKLAKLVDFLRQHAIHIAIHIPADSFLEDTKKHEAIANYVYLRKSLHHVPIINEFDWGDYIYTDKEIPQYLQDSTISNFVNRYTKLYSITGKNALASHIGRQVDFRRLPWQEIIDNTNSMPHYIRDDKHYEKLIGMIENYNTLLRYIQDNQRFTISDWEHYFQNPEHLSTILKNMKEAAGDITKNMKTVMALANTLQATPIGFPHILGNNKNNPVESSYMGSRAFAKRYFKYLKQLEKKYAGLYSIGGKIHTEQSIDDGVADGFVSQFGFNQTPFKLIHANTSVILPPSYFPEELMFMIQAMGQYGLFENNEKPQLQISIPGRLKDEMKAGILASSMILSSQTHVEYSPESFDTTHNSQTGRRMVSYDAGVYDPTFKYNSDGITGRTDVLLLRDINLIPKAKVIGSLLAQTEYDGWFADLGMAFIRDYMDLMHKYHLDHMITHKPWIFKESKGGDSVDIIQHYQAVKAFTDRQATDWLVYNNTQQSKGLLVFEFQKLLQTYRKKIESIQSNFR